MKISFYIIALVLIIFVAQSYQNDSNSESSQNVIDSSQNEKGEIKQEDQQKQNILEEREVKNDQESQTNEQANQNAKKPDDKIPPKQLKVVQLGPLYLNKQHEHLVKDYFQMKPDEWIITGLNNKQKFDLRWTFYPSQIDWRNYKEGQYLVNHIENIETITDKSLMLLVLRQFDKFNTKYDLRTKDYLPKTFSINYGTTKYSYDEQQFMKDSEKGLWISKPTNSYAGMGIEIIRDIDAYKKNLKEIKKDKSKHVDKRKVIQKYIEKPILINKKKFDFRCFVFIVTTQPKFLAIYHHGFVRKTLFDYTLNSNPEDDLNVHLTNISAQKKHPEFKKLTKDLMLSMEEFEEYFLGEGGYDKIQLQYIYGQMKEISSIVVQASQLQLIKKKGQFQVIGFDFMVDENLKVYLIELNKSPSWQIQNYKQEFKQQMLHRFIDTAILMNENPEETAQNIEKHLRDTKFSVLYNEYTGYSYKNMSVYKAFLKQEEEKKKIEEQAQKLLENQKKEEKGWFDMLKFDL